MRTPAGVPREPVIGLASLDRELGGWLQPGLHILHSNSGTGKTALGWQAVTTARHPALFVFAVYIIVLSSMVLVIAH